MYHTKAIQKKLFDGERGWVVSCGVFFDWFVRVDVGLDDSNGLTRMNPR
jgi:hypothetical protein